jgi:hypothetical protein
MGTGSRGRPEFCDSLVQAGYQVFSPTGCVSFCPDDRVFSVMSHGVKQDVMLHVIYDGYAPLRMARGWDTQLIWWSDHRRLTQAVPHSCLSESP